MYPAYAGAYNNLGVIYFALGDDTRAQEALQKAISVNDHFAPAYVNLARLEIRAGDFPEAADDAGKGGLVRSHEYDDVNTARVFRVHGRALRRCDCEQPTRRMICELPMRSCIR